MVRSALTALALVFLPIYVAAQQPVATASRVHVVVRGETLWGLAGRYYDDPFLWPRIFEANRSQISDPDLILPAQEFVIPGLPGVVPAVVGGVEVSAVGPAAPVTREPPPPPVVDERARRSTFFRQPNTSTNFRGPAQDEYLTVSRASSWSAEWLGPADRTDIPYDGKIESFIAQGDLRTALPYTRVRVTLNPGVRVRVGDALQVYRPIRSVEGLGWVIRPSGVMSVTRADGQVTEAVVLQSFERVLLGDLVRPAPAFRLVAGQYPYEVTNRTAATVVEFGGSHALYGLGDIAILDRGGDQGVTIGDEYVVFEGDGLTEEEVGRLRVVATESRTASARIVSVEGPVFRRGISVHLDRKMR